MALLLRGSRAATAGLREAVEGRVRRSGRSHDGRCFSPHFHPAPDPWLDPLEMRLKQGRRCCHLAAYVPVSTGRDRLAHTISDFDHQLRRRRDLLSQPQHPLGIDRRASVGFPTAPIVAPSGLSALACLWFHLACSPQHPNFLTFGASIFPFRHHRQPPNSRSRVRA